MSFISNVPPSEAAKSARMDKYEDTGEEKTKKREDYKKLKELEEARKAGTAPAMKDEEGKDINPHIPQYIMQAPWYFGTHAATLKHQRQQAENIKTYAESGDWYKRGVKEGPIATKYRKGACENCGAVTHKKKDCLERPRRLGAKYTGEDIAPDEYNNEFINHDYEGKRDRWNGYNIDDHKQIFEEYQKMEEAKKILKGQNLEEAEIGIEAEKTKEKKEEDEDDEDKDDEDKYAEDMDMPGHKFETKQRITVRNLRIREDTAKYLYNLDVESAHYDPKTRSMRENPFQEKDPAKIPFAGDNFVRMSGDAMGIAKRQMFAWEAYEKGAEVHLQADPTKLETLVKEYHKRKDNYKTKSKDSIVEKYGGEEHLEAPPKQLLLAQTEDYVEYSRTGSVIKGQEKAKIKSRYEEDIYLNNHTSVWGSYWKDGQWGFQCCHSTIKESYCTGQSGIEAAQTTIPGYGPSTTYDQEDHRPESDRDMDKKAQELQEMINAQAQKVEEEKRKRKEKKKKKKKDKKRKKKRKKESSDEDSSSSSEDEETKKEKKIKEAIKKEKKRVEEVDKVLAMDERKRKYNCMYNVKEPTEDEIEAFRRTRKNMDDPMANFL